MTLLPRGVKVRRTLCDREIDPGPHRRRGSVARTYRVIPLIYSRRRRRHQFRGFFATFG
jgi:hypothetical protein